MSVRSGSLIQFPRVSNDEKCEASQRKQVRGGRPTATLAYFRADLVLKNARSTRNVITVARRMGCRANDVFLVVLDRLEVIEQAIGRRAA